jgi:3-dehydroquinate synthase
MSSGDSDNLILTGFMGTGKSSVGREAARRLGRIFVDMDAEIERRAGKPIRRIFYEDGEAAFRQMEAALCAELSDQRGLVIATGGGALVNPASQAVMMASGPVICLSSTADEILQRLHLSGPGAEEGPIDRPLLNTADPRAEINRLLALRHEAYASIPWQIDTTGLTIHQVTDRVLEVANIITLPVRPPGTEYEIHIGTGMLAHAGGVLRATGVPEGNRVAVVSNPVVMPLYGDQVEASLCSAGFHPFACTVPDGEQYKTLATVAALYDQFLAGRLDRGSTVLALGGGVTGDIAGFAAASFMRGVRFVQVPTTLLAMVDSSVGGKTGVDLPQGKNLVGAFKQPAVVMIDPAVLETLPKEEFRSGLIETLKHGIISDPGLFAELAHPPDPQITTRQIAQALRVKIEVVEQDPYEGGRRAVLNLGHTVGHALEKLSDYALRHGEAVGIGMVAAARIAAELGQAAPPLASEIESVLTGWGSPTRSPPHDVDAIWEAMTHDKKRRGHNLRWVLPHAIGKVGISDQVPKQVVTSILRTMGAKGPK